MLEILILLGFVSWVVLAPLAAFVTGFAEHPRSLVRGGITGLVLLIALLCMPAVTGKNWGYLDAIPGLAVIGFIGALGASWMLRALSRWISKRKT